MANTENITTKFKVDISDLKKGISEANQQIKLANAEFKAAASGMDDWGKSADGIKAKLKQLESVLSAQKSKLESYQSQLKAQQSAYDENGKRADELRAKLKQLADNGVSKTADEYKKYQKALTDCEKEQAANQKAIDSLNVTILNQQGAVSGIEKDIRNYTAALDELGNEAEDTAEKNKEANDGFTIMKGILANLGTQAINAAIDALKSLGDAVVEVGKQAIQSYADYEQLAGGVETLFGAGGQSLEEYAKTAKVTAKDIENSGINWDKYANTAWMENGGIQGLFEEMQYNFDDLKTSAEEVEDYLHWEYDLDVEDAKKAVESFQNALTDESIQKKYESLIAAQEGVMNNAAQAYKTAGMNANEYMETVTSFSASLISSLGGDTEAAVKYADMAIVDMSDNANKMGSDMASIQNAYQGFAKQNYTMLDNLKLGYGGTKEEMQRLIDDANKVKEANGEMADLSIDSFSDVVDAIHIIQSEMGITGTTAKEASETISGSAASMQSAWENLVTGLADANADTELLMNNFVDSVATYLGNLLPVISQTLSGMTTMFGEKVPEMLRTLYEQISSNIAPMAEQGTQLVMALITAVLEALPLLIDAGVRMIGGILSGIGKSIPNVVTTVVEIIPQIVQGLVNGLPDLIQGAVTLLMGIVQAVPQVVQALYEAVPQIIDSIVEALVVGIPALIDGAIELLMAIVDAIPQILPIITENLPKVINAIVNGLITGIDAIIDGAVQLLHGIIEAIPILIQSLIPELPSIVTTIIEVLLENVPLLLEGAIELFMALVEAIPTICVELLKAIPQIIEAIFEGLAEFPGDLGEFFADAWKGIQEVFAPVGEWFGEKFETAKTSIETAWKNVGTWFGERWSDIKTAFSKADTWFGDKFESAKNFAQNPWKTTKQWAEGKWSDIKTAFAKADTWLGDKFGGALKAVKDKFGPVTKWFSGVWDGIKKIFKPAGNWFGDTFDKVGKAVKTPLNAVIKAMNKVIRGLNKISIDIPDWVPGVGGKTFGFNISEIPELAQGGVLRRGQMGLLEGSGAEAVVPLEKNKQWIRAVANDLLNELQIKAIGGQTSNLSNSSAYNFTQIINAPKQPSRIELYRQTRNLLSYAKEAGGV